VFVSNPAKRGQMIGNVTGGLLAGMMLAWPIASFVSGRLGWRPLFGLDAFLILVLTIALAVTLPCSAPVRRIRYPELVRSLWGLVLTNPELRRRAFVQALLFACFSLFWTAAPLELARDYGLGSDEVALFGLVGGAGAFIAPLAGRIADRGKATAASRVGMVAIIVAYLMSASISRLWVMAGVAVVINAGVQMNHVISQRAVLSLRPDASSRLNGLYVAIFFLGGAVSSAIAVPLLLRGWPVLSLVGAGLGLAALGLWSIPARQQSVVSVVS
jgi:predicted MFS family arabinose efflux permease